MSYACFNREPFQPTYWVQDGYCGSMVNQRFACVVRQPKYIPIPHRTTTTCQYENPADKGCFGCKWRKEPA